MTERVVGVVVDNQQTPGDTSNLIATETPGLSWGPVAENSGALYTSYELRLTEPREPEPRPASRTRDPRDARFHDRYLFTSEDGDMIIECQDHIKFRVHSFLMSRASKFLRDALSQFRRGPNLETTINVPTNSETMAALLTLIYPDDRSGTEPSDLDSHLLRLGSFEQAENLVDGSRVLVMPKIERMIRELIIACDIITQYPLETYGLACRTKWARGIQIASTATLEVSLITEPSLRLLTKMDGQSVVNVQNLHRARITRFQRDLERIQDTHLVQGFGLTPFHWVDIKSKLVASMSSKPSGEQFREVNFWLKEPYKSTCNSSSQGTHLTHCLREQVITVVNDSLDHLPESV